MPMLMRTLLEAGLIHGDCMTVTGKTIAENLADVVWRNDQDVIRPASNPLSPTGGVVGLWGSLAPDGAIVKVAGMTSHRAHRGPARVFDGEEACFAAVEARRLPGRRGAGDPLRGAQGRSRHARDAVDHRGALRPGPRRQGRADHRWPLLGRHARALRRPRRPRGPGRRPDRAGRKTATSSPSTPTPARSSWRSIRSSWRTASATGVRSSPTTAPARFGSTRKGVGPAYLGAVTHPGMKGERKVYADI